MDNINDDVNDKGRQSSTVGVRVAEERKRLGLSQAAFAKEAGVHRQTQSNYEQGERKPDADYLHKLAKLGVDVSYVLTGESSNEALQAYRSVLDAIRVELRLYKGFEQDWASILELSRESYRQFLTGKPDQANLDSAVAVLLARSPRLIAGPDDLTELIDRLEFVADSLGVRLSPSDKANALWRLLEAKSANGVRSVDFSMIKSVLQGGG